MKTYNPTKTCRVRSCGREIPERKEFCIEHWVMVPWVLKEWLVRTVYVMPDYPGIHKGTEWQKALRECQFAVEEFLQDSRPTLHG